MDWFQLILDISPFSSTEYWQSVIQNSIGCAIGSFIAIAISLWIYFDSLKKTERAKMLAKRNEETSQLKAFAILLNGGLATASHQKENIKKFVDDLLKATNDFPLMTFVSLNDLKRIVDSITIEKTGLAYMNVFSIDKDAAKDFTSILASVDYLYEEYRYIPDQMKRAIDFDYQRKKQMQELFAECFKSLGDFMLTQNLNDPIPTALQEIMINYQTHHTNNYDMAFYYEKFFVPLNDFFVQVLADGDRSPFFISMAQMTRDGKQIFEYIKSENKRLAEELNEILPTVDNEIQLLEKNSSKLLLAYPA